MSNREKAIIAAMKYLAKHNTNLRLKVDKPNKYRNTWQYNLVDTNKAFFGTIQSLEIRQPIYFW